MGLFARHLDPVHYRSSNLGIAFDYPRGGRVAEDDDVLIIHPNATVVGVTLVRVFLKRDRLDAARLLLELERASESKDPLADIGPVKRRFGELESLGHTVSGKDGCTETHVLRHPAGSLVIKLHRGDSTVIGRLELFRLFGESLVIEKS